MSKVRVPSELRREFADFRDDFDAVWSAWVRSGDETEAARSHARENLGRWINQAAELPDAVARLRAMFAYWSGLRERLCPLPMREVGVVPLMSESELSRGRAGDAVRSGDGAGADAGV